MKKILLFTNLFFLFILSLSAQTKYNVSMDPSDVFVPANLTINKNDTVVWTNNDIEGHTSTSGSACTPAAGWDSGILANGQTFFHIFTTAGTFPYYCAVHCPMMTGTITVNDVGVTGTNSSLSLNQDVKSFPNPFTESVTVEFELAKGGSVKVELYNMQGQKIITPLESSLGSGKHSINISGSELKTGLYVCKLFINDSHAGTNYLVKSK